LCFTLVWVTKISGFSREHWPAHSPREGLVLFLEKKNQNSNHQKCFFALKAFALQNGQNLGRDYFAPAQ
jgi:hypothetical protein